MDRVTGKAEEQAVSYGMQGTVCSCSFSVAKCCCFTPLFFFDSPFVVLSCRGGGDENHLLFQTCLKTCLMLLLTSFGEGCNSGSLDPCRVTLVRDGLRRRTMGTVAVVGVSLLVQNFTCSTSGEVEMLVRTMASAYLISPPMAGVKSSSIQVKAVISGWDLFRG